MTVNPHELRPARTPSSPEPTGVSANLLTYLGVLARRKWVMVAPLVLVPLIVVAATLRQDPVYKAVAQVFLSRGNLAASLAGVVDPNAASQPERVAQTQAELAQLPEVARRALDSLGMRDRPSYKLLNASRVTTDPNADLLYFAVRDGDATLAQRLATAYAQQFVTYRQELDSRAIDEARKGIQARLDALRAAGGETSPLYSDLIAKKYQLETLDALQTTSASVVRPADFAVQVAPRSPTRSAALGLGLGIALAIALAFLVEALDTRVKTIDEIEEQLSSLPLLARIPAPSGDLSEGGVEMLTDPRSRYSESIRMLRVRLGLARPETGSRLIMVTSASAREGKSTMVANLAVALARAGRSVILCDLDARRPMADHLFQLGARPGLTEVVLGEVELDNALVNVVPSPQKPSWPRAQSRNGHLGGLLQVLPLGRTPADPGEFVGSDGVAEVLQRLRSRADVVLVDTPALLAVGDAMSIAGLVDALVLVVRLGLVRRSTLREVARVLESSPAAPLGFVVTGSSVGDRYSYGWYYDAPVSASAEQESIRQ